MGNDSKRKRIAGAVSILRQFSLEHPIDVQDYRTFKMKTWQTNVSFSSLDNAIRDCFNISAEVFFKCIGLIQQGEGESLPFTKEELENELHIPKAVGDMQKTASSLEAKISSWPKNSSKTETASLLLSAEQQKLLSLALKGKNVLVDACVGSGKTTAIQALCNEVPEDKAVLYLTYNRLLKIDAQKRIRNGNATVTNYHGFAYSVLNKVGIHVGVNDLIQKVLQIKPQIGHYDLLILDEYQDIDEEISKLLTYIKAFNPDMQIVAVGDMMQKIYDNTQLKISAFINSFLGEYETLAFTNCFRLNSDLAARLGRIWGKPIRGVNNGCVVELMDKNQVVAFLAQQKAKDILCIGRRTGIMSEVLNDLERDFSSKFNKKTVYASIADRDSLKVNPDANSAIFTTYDSSKGLERPICVVFDYTERYWESRLNQPLQSYEILRNLFCVAASRGKERIIFVNNGDPLLSEKTLKGGSSASLFKDVSISDMFDFKYREDVEKCYNLLNIKLQPALDRSIIEISSHDELIDLSPCIGRYQEAIFFQNYDLDREYQFLRRFTKGLPIEYNEADPVERKILVLTAMEEQQERYATQVNIPFVSAEESERLRERLGRVFHSFEKEQVECRIPFAEKKNGEKVFTAIGYADVVTSAVVYELKFITALAHEHFLQCACYMIALNKQLGILWNTRDNTAYSITINNKKAFMDAVASTVTKGRLSKYYHPHNLEKDTIAPEEAFAVIDTETNWDGEVFSIGVVIADPRRYSIIKERYYVIPSATTVGGMYADQLYIKDVEPHEGTREEVIKDLKWMLLEYDIQCLFAYNAAFDRNVLPELGRYKWFDIMGKAAYKQYNPAIPDCVDCFKTGKMKSGYGVEPMLNMLTHIEYHETHNALMDAKDELKIMQLLGLPLSEYEIMKNPKVY